MTAATEIAERFKRETANHEMTVLHDEGLYRHVRFMAPKSGLYHFDLVTWPGYLSISGDLDGYVFRCADDMFQFFRSSAWNGKPNFTYWAEKVTAGRDGLKTYSEDLLHECVADVLKDAEENFPGVTDAWTNATTGFLPDYYTTTEQDARYALENFTYLPEGENGEPFRFNDTWEWNLRDYDWSYLWACHAIVWGITRYDAAKAAGREAVAS